MKLYKVGVSYSEITPESASRGDYSDTGWDMDPKDDWILDDILTAIKQQGYEDIQISGSSLDIYGPFYTSCYKTGTETQHCIHIDCTESEAFEILNLLKEY